MGCVKRDEAREKFKNLGLTYDSLLPVDITQLAHQIKLELDKYKITGGDHAQKMDMSVAPMRKKDIIFKNKRLVSARIQIDGSYFKRREGVTFSQTGFIGFGAEFSDVNVGPILKAFCKWCEDLKAIESMDEEGR